MTFSNIDWPKTIKSIVEVASFSSDSITVIVGLLTLFALLKYKSRFGALLRFLRTNHVNDRVTEVQVTLDLVLSTQIPKGGALMIRSLFGRLNGQILPLLPFVSGLDQLQIQVNSIAHEAGQLNEAIKQQIVHQIKAQLESSKFMNINELIGEQHE